MTRVLLALMLGEIRGNVRHELSILLLKPGIALADVGHGKVGAASSRAVLP